MFSLQAAFRSPFQSSLHLCCRCWTVGQGSLLPSPLRRVPALRLQTRAPEWVWCCTGLRLRPGLAWVWCICAYTSVCNTRPCLYWFLATRAPFRWSQKVSCTALHAHEAPAGRCWFAWSSALQHRSLIRGSSDGPDICSWKADRFFQSPLSTSAEPLETHPRSTSHSDVCCAFSATSIWFCDCQAPSSRHCAFWQWFFSSHVLSRECTRAPGRSKQSCTSATDGSKESLLLSDASSTPCHGHPSLACQSSASLSPDWDLSLVSAAGPHSQNSLLQPFRPRRQEQCPSKFSTCDLLCCYHSADRNETTAASSLACVVEQRFWLFPWTDSVCRFWWDSSTGSILPFAWQMRASSYTASELFCSDGQVASLWNYAVMAISISVTFCAFALTQGHW